MSSSERRRQRREKISDYVDANRKSPLVGSVYALIFGPLGCIYTDPRNSLFGVLAAMFVGLIYWPLIAIVWLACIFMAPFQVKAYNERVRRSARHLVI